MLKPDMGAEQRSAPASAFFYDRVAPREGLARLKTAYIVAPGSKDTGELPAGTLLYKTHTVKDVFYCSARGIRRESTGGMLGGAMVHALSFGFASSTPRQAAQQCFRDADADGLFDQDAAGVISSSPLSFRIGISIEDVKALKEPIAYEEADPEQTDPPLEVGLSAFLRDEAEGTFDIQQCIRAKDGEFGKAYELCFPQTRERVSAKRLPAKIGFLDGTILITGLMRDDAGWKVAYTVSKPVTATGVSITTRASTSGAVQSLLYVTPVEKR